MSANHLTQPTANDGAGPVGNMGMESREPLSGEPAGWSHRDGLSAAPSPVARWERWTISVEEAGRILAVLALGIGLSVGAFLAWAVIKHGR